MKHIKFSAIFFLIWAPSLCQEDDALMDMTLEQLLDLDVKVEVASKNAEALWDAPGIVTVIGAREIEQFGADNLVDILNRITSVYMLNTYFSSDNYASVRGDSQTHYNNHTLLLLNGRPIRDSEFGSFVTVIYKAFPIAALDRIEVIRGPGSVLYGASAYAGVINLVTRSSEETVSEVTLHSGSFGSRGAAVTHSGSWQGLGFHLSGLWQDDDGDSRSVIDEGGTPVVLDHAENSFALLATLDYEAFSLDAFAIRTEYDYWGTSPNGPNTSRDMARFFGNLGWAEEYGDWSLDANLTYNQLKSYDGVRNGSEDFLLELTAFYRPNQKTTLTFGALTEDLSGEWIGFIPPYEQNNSSAYFQAEYRPTERLKWIVGGQYNKPDNGDADFVPRIGNIWRFSENTGLKILYGEAFRSPAAIETMVSSPPILLGNSDLIPEKVTTSELQVFHERDQFQIAGTVFHTEQKDLIGRRLVPDDIPFFSYANLGSGTFWGLELEGKLVPSDQVYVTYSATYQENEDQDGVGGFTALPEIMAKIGLVRRFGSRVTLGLFDSFFGDHEGVATTNPDVAVVNPTADAFHMVSANLTWTVGRARKLDLGLFVQNALDEDIFQPELARRRINTVPAFEGRSVRAFLSWKP